MATHSGRYSGDDSEANRSRRAARKQRRNVMGSHQRCWLWGRHAVLEALRSGRWPARELVVTREFRQLHTAELPEDTEQGGTRVTVADAARLTQLCGSREHQGVIASMPPFPYGDETTLRQLVSEFAHPLLLLLDSLQDPHNFGAILRSAEVLGAHGVIVGTRSQADINSQVVRSSAGAIHYVPLIRVDELTKAVEICREARCRIVAAAGTARATAAEIDFTQATVLIIGNEGRGISAELQQLADDVVAIPQRGRIDSLNAAVSAGILLYEVDRQRHSRNDNTK